MEAASAVMAATNNASNNHPPKTNEFDNWDNDIQVSLTSTKNIIEIFVKKMVKKMVFRARQTKRGPVRRGKLVDPLHGWVLHMMQIRT